MSGKPRAPHALVEVRAGGRATAYPVLVGEGLLAELPGLLVEHAPGHRYCVLSDTTVAELYGRGVREALEGAGLDADLHTFPAGERHKTREWWQRLTDAMLAAGHGRDSVVVAVGGGVTGDLAGFVAASYLRGIPVVQVPTSLVAMIDASVGGKTGVDVPAGKNLVGAFHSPRLVVADPAALATLPPEERAQGMAEALKHGAILDEGYFRELQEGRDGLMSGDVHSLERAVARSVELKAGVVCDDELEHGTRQILNFGHTLGHALEAASGYGLPHGSAVALGMALEARLGEDLGVTEEGTSVRIARAVEGFGLPVRLGLPVDPDRVAACLGADKKSRRGRARYVLLRRVGSVAVTDGSLSREVPDEAVARILEPLFS